MNFAQLVFGAKPDQAKFKKLKLNEEQSKSIAGNIENFGQIAALGDKYREFMTSQQNQLLPGYSDTLALGQKGAKQLLSTGEQFLTGELPPDVKAAVERSSAYQSFAGGYGGSGMAHGLTARDLGLTSLDLMKQGASMIGQGGNSAQQWAAIARGDMFEPGSMLTNPNQTANFDLQNAILDQQSRQFGFNLKAAPDPTAAGISNTIMSVLGAYMGGGMGGMGGKGGGGLAQAGQTSVPYNAGFTYDPNAFSGSNSSPYNIGGY